MKPARPEDSAPTPPSADDAEGTGVPGLTSWRAVYLCLLGGFLFYVVALAVITRVYAP